MPMPKLPDSGLQADNPSHQANTEVNVEATIRAMRDSVWVINEELGREFFRDQSLRLLEANVGHLELKMADTAISGSGQDLSDITAAINSGKEAIAILKAATTQ